MHDPDFQCEVHGLMYDFKTHCGMLRMLNGNCCDMTGTIRKFKEIDKSVWFIATFSGERLDTCYRLEKGKWVAGAFRPLDS